MAQFTVCDTCGAVVVDNLGNYSTHYAIKADLVRPPWSNMGSYKGHTSYVVCGDCFKKIKEGIANLTEMNFKGKVPVVHIQLSTMTNEKGEDDEKTFVQ